MKALVKAVFDPNPLIVKESYETLKKRLNDSSMFLEVSSMDSKIMLNKTSIEAVTATSPDVFTTEIKKQAKAKGKVANEQK